MTRVKKLKDVPAVVLVNPKYKHNVGGVLRACSCFDVPTLMWTGDRVVIDPESTERIPREERMKGYRDVSWERTDRPFDRLPNGIIPVGVEVFDTSEPLTNFEHPENAIYVFGPEDGSIPQVHRRFCHRFVHIPARHCLNLSGAVYVILADRMMKRQRSGLEAILPIGDMLLESRGDHGMVRAPTLESMGWSGK